MTRSEESLSSPPEFGDTLEGELDGRLLFDMTRDALVLADVATGSILLVNREAERLFERPMRELVGMHQTELHPQSGRDFAALFRAHVASGGSSALEAEVVTAGGRSIPVEISSRAFVTRHGRAVMLGAFRDITDRRGDAERLRESEARFRMLFEQMLAGFALHEIICDEAGTPVDYRFLAVNHAFERATGLRAEDLIGRTVLEVLPTTEREWIERYGRVALTGEPDHFESYSGALSRWYEVRAYSPVPGKFAVVFHDVTERRHAEEALKVSQALFQDLVETAQDLIWQCDPQGRFEYLNPAWAEALGYPIGEIMGRSYSVFHAPEVRERDAAAIKQLIRTGSLKNHETVCLARDGRRVHLVINARCVYGSDGRLLGTRGTAYDISERIQTEAALRASEERLAVTLRSIGDAVISTDTQGHVQLMNGVAEQLTGFPLDEARGRALTLIFRVVSGDSGQPWDAELDALLGCGTVFTLPDDVVLVARGGEQRRFTATGSPIRNALGEVLGTVLVFRDETARQQAEESLLRAEKLESLGLLAGGIAHDFNNLLGGLFGHVELAQLACEDQNLASVAAELNLALGACERARSLTSQLLTFAKGGAPRKRIVALEPILRDTARFALSGANVRCNFDIPPDLWTCEADPGQLAQVVENLVINAQHAMPTGGLLEIRARNVVLDAPRGAGMSSGPHVRITLTDHGVGIPRDRLTRVFDPFFTTKRAGSGLGLSTSHSIVHKHGGTIEVESEVGRGTTFTILLPATTADVETGRAETAESTGHGRVLVMDDEPSMRHVALGMLKRLGYAAYAVEEGASAVERVRGALEAGTPFDAAILDLTIPGGESGKRVADRLRAVDPHLVLVATTGYSEDPVIADPRAYGFAAAVEKPFTTHSLASALASVLQLRTRLSAAPNAPTRAAAKP